jgi:hypothetical protein
MERYFYGKGRGGEGWFRPMVLLGLSRFGRSVHRVEIPQQGQRGPNTMVAGLLGNVGQQNQRQQGEDGLTPGHQTELSAGDLNLGAMSLVSPPVGLQTGNVQNFQYPPVNDPGPEPSPPMGHQLPAGPGNA